MTVVNALAIYASLLMSMFDKH